MCGMPALGFDITKYPGYVAPPLYWRWVVFTCLDSGLLATLFRFQSPQGSPNPHKGILGTLEAKSWYGDLDKMVRLELMKRVRRVALGTRGNVASVGEGVWEMKYKKYRIYYCKKGKDIILLLGGDKNRQSEDINRAKEVMKHHAK